MRATESYYFAVVKSHAVENGTKVVFDLRRIRETSVRCAQGCVAVLTTRPPGYDRTLHLLNSANASKGPEVGVGDPRKFLCKRQVSKCYSRRHVDMLTDP